MPEKVFNESDSPEMQMLKIQISRSDLDKQVKSYGERDVIVFYAFQSDDRFRLFRFSFDQENRNLVGTFYYREMDNQGTYRQWSRQISNFPFDQETASGDIRSELSEFRDHNPRWRTNTLEEFRR